MLIKLILDRKRGISFPNKNTNSYIEKLFVILYAYLEIKQTAYEILNHFSAINLG